MKLYLLGGFLGSGKTTAIITAARILSKEELSVAVITNDQGSQLVDTALIRSRNIPGGEVSNGCFCCNYEEFYSAIQNLDASSHPDIIFAEAVGSCADLVATIVKPMFRFEPGIETILSVFADGPVLLSSLEGRSCFVSDDVQYLYKKQLEEAAILIINKSDVLKEGEIEKVKSILETDYPGKQLFFQDSRDETSVKRWLDIMNEGGSQNRLVSLNIDYEKYANGEAALAWLDALINIHSKGKAIDESLAFIDSMVEEISFQRLPIGHLKFFLRSDDWQQRISYTNGQINKENFNHTLKRDHASVLVNARVESGPDQLKQIFFQSVGRVEDQTSHVEVVQLDSFQPGYPIPTYRIPE